MPQKPPWWGAAESNSPQLQLIHRIFQMLPILPVFPGCQTIFAYRYFAFAKHSSLILAI